MGPPQWSVDSSGNARRFRGVIVKLTFPQGFIASPALARALEVAGLVATRRGGGDGPTSSSERLPDAIFTVSDLVRGQALKHVRVGAEVTFTAAAVHDDGGGAVPASCLPMRATAVVVCVEPSATPSLVHVQAVPSRSGVDNVRLSAGASPTAAASLLPAQGTATAAAPIAAASSSLATGGGVFPPTTSPVAASGPLPRYGASSSPPGLWNGSSNVGYNLPTASLEPLMTPLYHGHLGSPSIDPSYGQSPRVVVTPVRTLAHSLPPPWIPTPAKVAATSRHADVLPDAEQHPTHRGPRPATGSTEVDAATPPGVRKDGGWRRGVVLCFDGLDGCLRLRNDDAGGGGPSTTHGVRDIWFSQEDSVLPPTTNNRSAGTAVAAADSIVGREVRCWLVPDPSGGATSPSRHALRLRAVCVMVTTPENPAAGTTITAPTRSHQPHSASPHPVDGVLRSAGSSRHPGAKTIAVATAVPPQRGQRERSSESVASSSGSSVSEASNYAWADPRLAMAPVFAQMRASVTGGPTTSSSQTSPPFRRRHFLHGTIIICEKDSMFIAPDGPPQPDVYLAREELRLPQDEANIRVGVRVRFATLGNVKRAGQLRAVDVTIDRDPETGDPKLAPRWPGRIRDHGRFACDDGRVAMFALKYHRHVVDLSPLVCVSAFIVTDLQSGGRGCWRAVGITEGEVPMPVLDRLIGPLDIARREAVIKRLVAATPPPSYSAALMNVVPTTCGLLPPPPMTAAVRLTPNGGIGDGGHHRDAEDAADDRGPLLPTTGRRRSRSQTKGRVKRRTQDGAGDGNDDGVAAAATSRGGHPSYMSTWETGTVVAFDGATGVVSFAPTAGDGVFAGSHLHGGGRRQECAFLWPDDVIDGVLAASVGVGASVMFLLQPGHTAAASAHRACCVTPVGSVGTPSAVSLPVTAASSPSVPMMSSLRQYLIGPTAVPSPLTALRIGDTLLHRGGGKVEMSVSRRKATGDRRAGETSRSARPRSERRRGGTKRRRSATRSSSSSSSSSASGWSKRPPSTPPRSKRSPTASSSRRHDGDSRAAAHGDGPRHGKRR